MLLVFLFLYAPILVLVVFSFNASKSKAVWAGFTLDWYRQLFQNDMILNALAVTLAVSALAAVISTVMGTAAAIGFRNLRRRFRSICLTVNNIPLTNADIITGVSMMLLFLLAISAWNGSLGQLTGVKWSMGFLTLLISHIAFDVPYVILSVMPKLSQLDPNIYEAAQDLGDHGFHAFYKVILPEISPAILSAFLICLTYSIDDFMISYFNCGTVETLPIAIYSMTRKKVSPEIYALSTIMFVVILSVILVSNAMESRSYRKDQKTLREEGA